MLSNTIRNTINSVRKSIFQSFCSYDLNGTDAYIDFGNVLNSTISGTNHTFSLQRLLKRGSLGTEQTIISKWQGLGDNRQFRLFFTTSNTIKIEFSNDGTSAGVTSNETTATFINLIQFYKITVTFDLSIGDFSGIKLYINNTQIDWGTPSKPFVGASTIYSGVASLLLGAITLSSGLKGRFFDGMDNDVAIYDDILTLSEIEGRYNDGDILNPHTDGLVFHSDYSTDTWDSDNGNYDVIDVISSNNGVTVNILENEKKCILL